MRRSILALLATLLSLHVFSQELSVEELTVENISNPLGIDTPEPRFSWKLRSNERNVLQSAYRISVSTKADFSNSVWESDRKEDSNPVLIAYRGEDLKPFTRYYWRVKVWDNKGNESAWSETAWFETAMMQQAGWTARWIGDGSKQFEKDEDFYQDDRMPLFRKEFAPAKKIASARLYISGLGYYEAYLNGKKIGGRVLEPGWTTYKEQVLYSVYDITAQMKQGTNVAGIMLGNGWYNPLPLRLFRQFNLRDFQQTGRPCVKAEFHLTYADGTTEKIVTDESWQTVPGPVVRNSVFLGEHYDARLEQSGWLQTDPEGEWKNAVAVAGPDGVLNVQMQPPIKVTHVLKAVSIKELSPGVYIADMGQNFAGVARIKVRGKAGTKITLRYGEALHPDGSLNFLTTVAGHIKEMWNLSGGPGAPATAWQEDSYTLKGQGTEIWSPRFTFHGFRYIEIKGWPGKPALDAIEGLRMNSDLPQAGEFACSNDMFNQLHEATKWTFLSNVFSVQSDCPGREKMGYGADIVVTANSFMYNFDMSNFYRKTVRDYANDQQPDGGITEIAPYTGIHTKGLGGESGPLGWQLAFPFVQKRLYEFYGDKRVIEENYDGLKKQIDFLQSKAIDGLFYWDISDHVALDPKPEAFSAAAFYYHHVVLAAEFAGILDQTEDSVQFTRLAGQIKRRIVNTYHVPNTGRFDNATQSAQLFALWYDLAPDKEAAFRVLLEEFERHNGHVSSGIFGVMMMFDVLREFDRNDVAYGVVNQRDYPGWGYMLAEGATTLWESWEYPDNAPTQNHPMFGSTEEWFYRSLLGINPAAAGFEKVVVKPQPVDDLQWAKGSYDSVRGNIESDWRKEGERFSFNVSIPPTATADIYVPCASLDKLTEGGQPVKDHKDFASVRFENGYAIIQAGSGKYSFVAE